ncbi:hypothetical protein LRS06_00470 [Hymenobacter sp. J193]|uniref:hypothetical protein n=1 Tax=Hymenobacter sp. J193 TaxID=2898429 RepID=UPI002151D299|nr:hypothetical protein [Hymenobacter sp. J193]MCR5886268.1 hypothetical protein [Hymenobacter sp. J193]
MESHSYQTMHEHLDAFMAAFLTKRTRSVALSEESKKAAKRRLREERLGINPMWGMDNLWASLDLRYCTQLPKGSGEQDRAFVRQHIAKFGLQTCYVLSADTSLHQLVMPVEDAIHEVVGSSNTSIISFIPGKVAYFEGHSVGDRWLCIREEKVYPH